MRAKVPLGNHARLTRVVLEEKVWKNWWTMGWALMGVQVRWFTAHNLAILAQFYVHSQYFTNPCWGNFYVRVRSSGNASENFYDRRMTLWRFMVAGVWPSFDHKTRPMRICTWISRFFTFLPHPCLPLLVFRIIPRVHVALSDSVTRTTLYKTSEGHHDTESVYDRSPSA